MKKMKQLICYSLIAVFAFQTIGLGGTVDVKKPSYDYKILFELKLEMG